jgi:hypothetical protein
VILCLAGYPVVNDPLYNHTVFGPEKGRGGNIGKTDEELIRDLINIHNAENWLGMDGDSELSMFKPLKGDMDDGLSSLSGKGKYDIHKFVSVFGLLQHRYGRQHCFLSKYNHAIHNDVMVNDGLHI